jgi:hypothetical protein
MPILYPIHAINPKPKKSISKNEIARKVTELEFFLNRGKGLLNWEPYSNVTFMIIK